MRVALAVALTSSLAWSIAACSDPNEPPASVDSGTGGDGDAGQVLTDAGTTGGDAGSASDAAQSIDGGVTDLCDPLLQTNCSAPATKCVIEPDQNNDGAHCVAPGANDVGLGDACTGEDCLAGLACVVTSTVGNLSSCLQVCNYATGAGCESLGAEYDCRTRITGTNWGGCALLPAVCDPLTQAPCAANEACSTFVKRNGIKEFRCRAAGPQIEGQACGTAASGAACARGLVCILDPTAVCKKFCDTNDDCTAPATCAGVVNDPPFMYCAQ